MSRRRAPRLLAISDGLDERTVEPWARRLAASGVDAVQLREKTLDDRRLVDLARGLRRLLPPPVRLLVNGRIDVALAAGADGVHLPSDGVPVDALRRAFGPRPWIGVSTHHPDEVAAARAAGADYATFGPVFPTPSKAGYGPPPGLAGLTRAAALGLPVLALGGVGPDEVEAVAAAGASGVAGIRAFARDESLARLATATRRAWGEPT